jgi:amidase
VLDVTGAPRVVGATRAPTPHGPFAAEVGVDPGALRIGFLDADPTGEHPLHPECVTAVTGAARLLESLGHRVEAAFPEPWADAEAMLRFGSVWATECAYVLDDWAAKVGREITEDDVEPLTWALAAMGRTVPGPTFMATVVAAMGDAAEAARWWRSDPTDDAADGYDLLLTPTVGEPPPPHGTFDAGTEHPFAGFIRAGSFVPFTTQSNISGQPAISLPLHWSTEGLPIGVQLVAGFGREDLLIRVAAQLEAAAPWADRQPPVHA